MVLNWILVGCLQGTCKTTEVAVQSSYAVWEDIFLNFKIHLIQFKCWISSPEALKPLELKISDEA